MRINLLVILGVIAGLGFIFQTQAAERVVLCEEYYQED
jgi:hypothetical protein